MKTRILVALWFLFACLTAWPADLILINVGNEPNDGLGDSTRTGFIKSNTNFLNLNAEHYSVFSNLAKINGAINPSSNGISVKGSVFATGPFLTTNAMHGEMNVCSPPFSAKGDGVTDDGPAIQAAINFAIASHNTLYIPPLTFLIGAPLTVSNQCSIRGSIMDQSYKGATPRRSVIKTAGSFTAIQTPRLIPPNDMMPNWAWGISIQDLYVMGPYGQGNAVDDGSCGFDFTGAYYSRLVRLHAEGFARGLLLKNCSDIYEYEGFYQNNYIGMEDARTPASGSQYYDCVTRHINTTAQNNTSYTLLLNNPRSASFISGSYIEEFTNYPNIWIKNCKDGDSQISFAGSVIENRAPGFGMIETDTNGFGSLIINNCVLETDQDMPHVIARGYFETILHTANNVQRSLSRTKPLIWAQRPTGANFLLRENRIVCENNMHGWFDAFIRNDQPGVSPLHDYVPAGFVNLNPNPAVDHSNDGIVAAGGDFQYITTNVLCGMARIAWKTDRTNNSYALNLATNYTRGIDKLFVSYTLFDDGNTNAPPLAAPLPWIQGTDWTRGGRCIVGQYTNADGAIFTKWVESMMLNNPAASPLYRVALLNIYGGTAPGTNTADPRFGLEQFSVFASAQKNQGIKQATSQFRTHSAIPSTGLEGYYKTGDFLFNDFTAQTNALGWVCTAPGIPGIWKTIYTTENSLPALPNIFGTLTPGFNVASNYWTGYGANSSWPMAAGVIYDVGAVDQYLAFNGSMSPRSTRIDHYWNGPLNVGGNFLRSHYDTTNGVNWFDIGSFPGGVETIATTAIRISSNGGITNYLPVTAPSISAASMTLGGSTITAWPSGGGSGAPIGTVINSAVTSDLLAVNSTKTNGTAATEGMITNKLKVASAANDGILSHADWATFNAKQPAFGVLSPGLNAPANYWAGYGASTGWPMAAGTIYDAGAVDQFLVFNGLMNSGSTRTNQIWDGSNAGGAFLRHRYDTGTGGNWFEIGNFASGTAKIGTPAIRIDADNTAGNTRFLLYDVTKGTLSRVSVGANDSGGAGYKVLRVPN